MAALPFLAGCATPAQRAARQQERTLAAQALFEQAVREYHVPAASARGADRTRLLQLAAAGYERVLSHYPDQPYWDAMALRSLGNVRVTQGRLTEAVKLYGLVAERYPTQDWEILQAWKTAADLLWEAGRTREAREFDQRIVSRFDRPQSTEVVRLIVGTAQRRLAGPPANP